MNQVNYYWIKQNIGEDGITYTPMVNLKKSKTIRGEVKRGFFKVIVKPDETVSYDEDEFISQSWISGKPVDHFFFGWDYCGEKLKYNTVQEAVKFIRKQYGKQANIKEM